MKSLGSFATVLGIAGILWLPVPDLQDGADPAPPSQAEEFLREAQTTLRPLNRLSALLPREPLEPEDLVDRVLGKTADDVDALTEWVSRSVCWLPYHGALRGPRGVLIERRGNSLDQSLLLAASIAATGREVRLAHRELPTELAEELRGRLRIDPALQCLPRPPLAGEEGAADDARGKAVAEVAEALGMDPAVIEGRDEELDIQGQEYLERVLPMAMGQARDLRGLLAEAGVHPPDAPDAPDEEAAVELDALRDHWWVQSSEDGETWTDRDPLARRCNLELAESPSLISAPDELPEELLHRLTLRIVAEKTGPEGSSTEVALSVTKPAPALSGSHFVVTFQPLNPDRSPPAAEGEAESGAYTLRVVAEETEWMPVVSLVDYLGQADSVHEASIRTDGTINRSPNLDAKVRKVNSAALALGGASDSSDTSLTAVWIEYEILQPEGPPRIVRRQVFDLLGAGRRELGAQALGFEPSEVDRENRGLALSGVTQVLPVTCNLGQDFGARLLLATQIKNQRIALELAQAMARGEDVGFADMAPRLSLPPLELFLLARMRFSVGPHVDRVFLDRVNVLANHVQPMRRENGEGGAGGDRSVLVYGRAIDIVSNPVGVLAGPEGGASAWIVRFDQGVLDSVLENLSLMGLSDAELDATASESDRRVLADSAALWLEQSPIEQWKAIAPGTNTEGSGGDFRARIATALADGRAVVAPRAALRNDEGAKWTPGCWWRVDPETGEALAIGPKGWGQEFIEDLDTRVTTTARWADPMRNLTANVFCFMAAAAARIAVGTAISTLGSGAGASELVRTIMAFVSQAGIPSVMYKLVELRCKLVVYAVT